MDAELIKEYLRALKFNLIDGEESVWIKQYKQHNNFEIKVVFSNSDTNNSKIIYGEQIKVCRHTTTDFNKPENLVVLECVNRLLEKGYEPEKIELEKGWRVGGYLDIFVKDMSGNSYLMIECKQFGREYNDAVRIILENNYKKEQLFNYYLQEKSTKYVALYCSKLNNGNFIYKNDIIPMEQLKECNNQNEIYELWDKVFQSKGIFEKHISPYNVHFLGITRADLKPFNQFDVEYGSEAEPTIYNRFAEILRRHVISDKTNAYNIIFNLFLCKIVDEDSISNDEDEMQFQWKDVEDAETVLGRLSDLYKKGMNDYLQLDVSDVTEDELDTELKKISLELRPEFKKIKEMFRQVRLYKNKEFAFKEVIDERTFFENAEVVKEVVKLLEPYQIKYSHKQQFLGEFFERLLNIGIKQEAGQFFTPTPITSFICRSIPFEDIIDKKISESDPNFLPYIIDFACGSGHFLTDAMERVEVILQNITEYTLKTKPQRDNLYGWKRSFKWAKEFIYGIERDYRLAKTTKLACFLYGDGEAKILYADGLDPFNSEFYTGKLHSISKEKDNPVFDVVIANPPYSVENFKYVLKNGKESFNLFNHLSDKSDDIECLFIERTNQLLKEGGCAGIIIPSTLLLTKGLHQKARKILLENFEIIGICGFGSRTFAATGQNTSILFLRKRPVSFLKTAKLVRNRFFDKFDDMSFNQIEKIFSKYLSFVYPDISMSEYVQMLQRDEKFSKIEKEKILFFLLTYNQQVVVTKSGEKNDEKKFLGYEHSNMKKYEGIHPYPDSSDGQIHSFLYDKSDLFNPEKVSSYVLNNFRRNLNPQIIEEKLRNHLKIIYLHEMIDFYADDFKNMLCTDMLDNPFLKNSKYELSSLGDKNVAEILDSKRIPVKKSKRKPGPYPYYGASGAKKQTISDYIFDEKLVLIAEDGGKWGKFKETSYIIDGKSWVNNHAHIIRPNINKLLHEYLVFIFNYLDFSYLKSRPNGGKLLKGEMTWVKFPLPTIEIQRGIIEKMNKIKGDEKYSILEDNLLKQI